MTDLFIPRQSRDFPPLPLLGIPRLRPEPGPPADATLEDLIAGIALPGRLRRGGPRHGRRSFGGRGPAPALAAATGLLVGLGLGAVGWVGLHPGADRPQPALTGRQVTVALPEATAGRPTDLHR